MTTEAPVMEFQIHALSPGCINVVRRDEYNEINDGVEAYNVNHDRPYIFTKIADNEWRGVAVDEFEQDADKPFTVQAATIQEAIVDAFSLLLKDTFRELVKMSHRRLFANPSKGMWTADVTTLQKAKDALAILNP